MTEKNFSPFSPKIFIPLCLAGIVAGYVTAEYIVPHYNKTPAAIHMTTDDILQSLANQPNYFRQTASGNYLAGQFAQQHKDWNNAQKFINHVLQIDDNNPDLIRHAMVVSMAAGDFEKAVAQAKDVLSKDPSNILAILFLVTDALQKQDTKTITSLLATIQNGDAAFFIVPALTLWAKIGSQSLNFENLPKNSFYAYHALLAGIYTNQKDEALSFAKQSFTLEENDIRDLEKYADVLLAYGEEEQSVEIYKSLVNKHFASKETKEKIAKLEQDREYRPDNIVPTITNPQEGVALIYQDMAEILLREFSDDSAIIFAQMAIRLNPNLPKTYAMMAEIARRHERFDEAIAYLEKIKPESNLYIPAQRLIADSYNDKKDSAKAIAILQNLYDINKDIDALIQIGDVYRYDENYTQAEDIYTKIIGLWEQVPEEYWHVLYARGMVREQLKKFKQSEEDLLAALKFQPENPYILNYLGYSWIDQGINLDDALNMVTRAVQYQPDDGYITDSLAWAYFKLGRYKEAVPIMERAIELEPYDPTINDHLGDIYWKVGRHQEARFQWMRAFNHAKESDTELRTAIEQKLLIGLDNSIVNIKNNVTEKNTEKQENL